MRDKLDYNIDWNEHFQLDKNSPSGLVRIKNRYGKAIKPYIVGIKTFRASGDTTMWRISFNRIQYAAHRIIWVLTYGSIEPEMVIDHLDGDPLNNSIENLRLTTCAVNQKNKRPLCSSKTGITGVSLTDSGNGCYYYSARWTDKNGKTKYKYFSISRLGEDVARNLAITYREQQIAKLIADGAEYTDRHGL